MNYIKKSIFLILSIIMLSIFVNSCKNIARVEIDEIWGRAVKIIGEKRSNFSTFARIFNATPGIEASVDDWSFKIFSGDILLFEVNNLNYRDFSFNISVSKPVNFMNGNMVIMVGLPYFDSFMDYVDEDIFQEKIPDTLRFSCSIVDMDGHFTNLTATNTLEFIEKDIK